MLNDRVWPGFTLGLVASALIFVVFASPIFSGAVYTHDDLLNFHLPLRALYASHLAKGQLPIWIPQMFCGFNLHAEGQVGLLHPLHLLLYAALPLPTAFTLEAVLPFLGLQVGTFVFLRRQRIERDAALFGSMIFAFTPALMLRFIHLNATAVFAHLPWLLVSIDTLLHSSGRKRAGAGLAIGLLTASQILLGYPAYVWYSVLAEALFALWLALPRWNWRGLANLAALKLLGLFIGAVQLVPTIQSLTGSLRRQPMEYSGDMTSRRELFILSQWFDPYLVWHRVPLMAITEYRSFHIVHEASLYCGAAIPPLVVWTLLRWRKGTIDRRLVRAAAVLGLVALTFAFIRMTPFSRLYVRIPVINLFRFSVRYYVVFALCAAVVAAVGLADLAASARRGERLGWRSLWPLTLPALLSAVLAVGATVLEPLLPGLNASLSSWPLNALGPALAWSAALLIVAAARGQRWAPAALIVLTAADLGYYNLSHIRSPIGGKPGSRSMATLSEISNSLPPPPQGDGYRVMDATVSDRLLLKGLHLAGGYVGLTPAKALSYDDDETARRVVGVGAVLLKPDEGKAPTWESVPNPLPRVRLVAEAKVSDDPGLDLTEIDPAVTALVATELSLVSGTVGQAHIVNDTGTQVRINAEAPSRQLLILAESNDPGWEVRVDGKVSEIVTVYGDLMGCVLPAGRHKVDFEYHSRSTRLGAIISLAALAALMVWWTFAKVERSPADGNRGLNPIDPGSPSLKA